MIADDIYTVAGLTADTAGQVGVGLARDRRDPGFPVMRETQAISDIWTSDDPNVPPGTLIDFISYNEEP
jgi:hypothetical protein